MIKIVHWISSICKICTDSEDPETTNHWRFLFSRPSISSSISLWHCCWCSGCLASKYNVQHIPLVVVSWPKKSLLYAMQTKECLTFLFLRKQYPLKSQSYLCVYITSINCILRPEQNIISNNVKEVQSQQKMISYKC